MLFQETRDALRLARTGIKVDLIDTRVKVERKVKAWLDARHPEKPKGQRIRMLYRYPHDQIGVTLCRGDALSLTDYATTSRGDRMLFTIAGTADDLHTFGPGQWVEIEGVVNTIIREVPVPEDGLDPHVWEARAYFQR